jgi:hypothetical protein
MASFVRTFKTLCRTPLVRQPSAGSTLNIELASLPVRPSMSSRISSSLRLQARPQTFRAFSTTPTRLASDKGKMELYSDESGSLGAGIDDVAKSDSAYDTSKGPEEAAEGVEKEVSWSAFDIVFQRVVLALFLSVMLISERFVRSLFFFLFLTISPPRPPPVLLSVPSPSSTTLDNKLHQHEKTVRQRLHSPFTRQQTILAGQEGSTVRYFQVER